MDINYNISHNIGKKPAFPSGLDKAETFVNVFTENSLSSNLNPVVMKFRQEEEQTEIYQDAFPDQRHYLNYPMQ